MINKNPLVSVVMPVYNAGDFLRPAINSILNQTYKNFEMIIVDDASTDDTPKLLKSLKNHKIRIYRNKKQLGITKSANFAIKKAKGEYIARMDGDDISAPQRLTRQVKYLLSHKNIVAVGAQCDLINAAGAKVGEKRFPLHFANIRKMIFVSVPVQQPSIMVAVKRLPVNFVWYDETYKSAEELELLFKLFEHGEVRNLPSKLLKYRLHAHNTSLVHPKQTFYLTLKTRIKAIKKYEYKPTLGGILITILETVLVFCLPEKLIYPIYSFVRNFKSPNINVDFDAKINSQESLEVPTV